MSNLILRTDSYKATHWKQYPKNTETVYSYFESRGGLFDEVVFFGLQYYLKKYLEGCVVTQAHVEEADRFFSMHFGDRDLFNRSDWEYIVNEYDGCLPVSIKAVPEGSVIPTGNVLMTVENTDPRCYWLTNYLETLLVQVWYGCTVATQSRKMKQVIATYLEVTGTPGADLKLHDFGFRGVSSVETAGVGGAAHLVNFRGTDNLEGVVVAHDYYNEEMAGFSIPANEHSTITSWLFEEDAMENMLTQYPTGPVSCVSDSYNIYKACREYWGESLKQQVLERDGTLVIRPDSGDPVYVITSILHTLYEKFGGRINEKGYRVLDDHVRIIQGDGVDLNMICKILDAVQTIGFSADNIVFGSGGGLLQKLNRDTQKFAFKCSAAKVDGAWRDVYKTPITDSGKNSKRGQLKLVKEDGEYRTKKLDSFGVDQLVEVFRDGELLEDWSLSEIRKRAKI